MAGSTTTGSIGAVGDFIDAVAYAIELVTFSMFFFEEGFQNFLRAYHSSLYRKNLSEIMVLSINSFDYMMKWWIEFYNTYGFIAVYSADGYMANIYMNLMYREYGNILMGKGYLAYEMSQFGVPWWHGMGSYLDTDEPGIVGDAEMAWEEIKHFFQGET